MKKLKKRIKRALASFLKETELSVNKTLNIKSELKHLDKRINQLTKDPNKYYYESRIRVNSYINKFRTIKNKKNGIKKTK